MTVKWSYSSLKLYQQCAKQYYHVKVLKEFPPSDTEATLYGKEMHEAAEYYINDGVPLPAKFSFLQKFMDAVNNLPGARYCELKLGIKRVDGKFEACDFDDPDYWWHGIADLVVVGGRKAYSVDYKTSKNAKYADLNQLRIMSAALFLHFPHLIEIKSALAFVVSNEFVKETHHAMHLQDYLNHFNPELTMLSDSFTYNVWNAQSGPLCKFCPVKSCEHHPEDRPSFCRK